jgi:hypothetical protein
VTELGTVIAAREIGSSEDSMRPLKPKKAKPGKLPKQGVHHNDSVQAE